ncbi:MAG: SWIM zinc finger family protein [Actinomycetota bacterium]
MTRRSWDGTWYEARPRRAVEGGVVVAKPGKVTGELAAEMVAAAEMETSSSILARGRTYARAGQVVALEVEEGRFTAQIQGSAHKPYRVSLTRTVISGSDRIAADCSCPYGCDFGWCKHAAALAYVAAHLLDTQPATVAAWSGDDDDGGAPAGGAGPGEAVAGLSEEELAVLRRPAPVLDAAQLLAAAEELVPHPWGIVPGGD